MTTSGVYSFTQNRDQLIKAALRKVGAISAGETPGYQTILDASDQLNMLMKSLMATGLHVWTETEAILFMAPGQVAYTLGGSTTDHASETYDATTLTANAASGATSITVDSIADIADADNIAVVLDDGTFFWTTVSGAPSGSTVTLASALTGAATSGAAVYNYTDGLLRPLRVVQARRYTFVGQLDTPMIELSRLDYRALPNKMNTGTVTQFFYDPKGGASNQGVFYVWPAPVDATTTAVKFTWWRPIQDFVSASNTPDLPQEWLDCMIWNLAYKMAPEYDVPPARYAMLKEQAASSLDLLMAWDREPESYLFGFNADQTQR